MNLYLKYKLLDKVYHHLRNKRFLCSTVQFKYPCERSKLHGSKRQDNENKKNKGLESTKCFLYKASLVLRATPAMKSFNSIRVNVNPRIGQLIVELPVTGPYK